MVVVSCHGTRVCAQARRRKMVVEQQSAAADAERKAQLEALVSALQCQSNEEQRLAARLWQVGLRCYSTTTSMRRVA